MQSRPWVSFVGWCIALGVPMTPLAGTWIGYGLLGLAAFVTLSQGVSWINQQNWQTEYKKYALLIPSALLVIMASVWSWYGGLPAILVHSRPYISLARITSMERTAYQVGAPIMANLYIKNETTEPITMVGKSRFVISTGLPSKMEDLRKIEEEHWAAFKQWATSSAHLELTIPPLKEVFISLKGPSLTEQHVTLLNGSGNAAVYFMGVVTYTEPNGNSATEEFCGFFTADPPRTMMLCAKHNGIFRVR